MIRTMALTGLVIFLAAATTKHEQHLTRVIRMEGMRFNPKTIEVFVGDSIVWVNESNGWHNVVADDGSFSSGLVKKGGAIGFKFDKPGTFKYYCQPHRIMGMKGVIVVK